MTVPKIQMVDLQRQYQRLSSEIDQSINDCLQATDFIQGKAVREFEKNIGNYISSRFTISCGNGTDALMLALMALNLQKGDKVIVPAFTYIACVEVLKLLGLEPVYCDVDERYYMPDISHVEAVYTPECKAVIIVHLFGQVANMESIMRWANENQIFIIEDNAQAIGAQCVIDGQLKFAGTIGHIGTTSFFPSKNLGAYGDGGAVFTQNEEKAKKIRMMANHGQSTKYIHDIIGVNSRLDTIQSAILNVKLNHLQSFTDTRQYVAKKYDEELKSISSIKIPSRIASSTHVFHQYTIVLDSEDTRNQLQLLLKSKNIPSAIYYPMPVYRQSAYFQDIFLENTEKLCQSVLSLPIHTEMTDGEIDYICDTIKNFFNV